MSHNTLRIRELNSTILLASGPNSDLTARGLTAGNAEICRHYCRLGDYWRAPCSGLSDESNLFFIRAKQDPTSHRNETHGATRDSARRRLLPSSRAHAWVPDTRRSVHTYGRWGRGHHSRPHFLYRVRDMEDIFRVIFNRMTGDSLTETKTR